MYQNSETVLEIYEQVVVDADTFFVAKMVLPAFYLSILPEALY